ncbi:MAG: hypothetical protein QW379_02445 [Thermoplasmata archaeon]
MMLPRCREVGYKRVDFPLTREELEHRLVGRKIFTGTDYIILESGGGWGVVGVKKRRGLELLREITSVTVHSLPAQTDFVRDPECDVQNPHMMARIAARSEKETVVVLGKFNHISFITGGKSVPTVKVVDIVPPRPSKTLELVNAALASGVLESPLLVEPVLVDALDLISSTPGIEGSSVMFPCEAGCMEVAGKELLYLDKTPPLPPGPVILAGCRLTEKTFRLVYDRRPVFVDICPRELARSRMGPRELAVARCCEIHRVTLEGTLALLPYGATAGDAASALRRLLALAGEDRNALNRHHQ